MGVTARREVPATVLASPMGKRLYEKLGFGLDGSFMIQVEGEEEKLEIWALTKDTQVPNRA
jgi:hypothetical protein